MIGFSCAILARLVVSSALANWQRSSKVSSFRGMLSRKRATGIRMVSASPSTYNVIFSSSLWTLPQRKMALLSLFRYSCSSSSGFCWVWRRFSSASLIVAAVAYVRSKCWTASGQQLSPPRRDAPLRFVRNCVSAGSSRNIGSAMNACASDMLSMWASLTNLDRKSKMRMGSVPSKMGFSRTKLRFLIWIRTSAVERDDQESVMFLRR